MAWTYEKKKKIGDTKNCGNGHQKKKEGRKIIYYTSWTLEVKEAID